MAATAWLASLPQAPLAANIQEVLGENKLSFKPDYGDPIERNRFTSTSDTGVMSFQMTLQQYRDFRTFYKTTLGSGVLDFSLYDDILGAVKDYHIDSSPTASRNAPDGIVVSFNVLRRT